VLDHQKFSRFCFQLAFGAHIPVENLSSLS